MAICPKRRQLACRATAQSHCRLCKPHRRASFDHLVGAGEQRRRNGEVERLRSSYVDARDELRRKLNRQVGGLAAFENSIDEIGGSAMILGIVHAITYESAGLDIRVLTGDGPVRLALTTGEAHDNRLAAAL